MINKNGSIWVTGASSGIGKEITAEFLKLKYTVGASARRIELIESMKKQNEFNSENLIPVELDVTNTNMIVKTIEKINRVEPINCLINNAGVTAFKPAIGNDFDEIKEIIDTNLSGAIYSIRALLPYFIEQGKGTVINILSVAAEKIFTNSGVYSASKAGLRAYTNVLREEVRKHNIKIINILPGATKTPIWPNEALEKFSDRMMSPADIAKLVVELYQLDGTIVPEEITIRPMKGDLE